MEFNIIEIITALAAVAIGVILWLNRGGNNTVTIEGVADTIDVAGDIWEDAREFVAAAEQLYSSGRIEKDSRFRYVFEALQKQYPDVDTKFVEAAIEAGVWHLRQWQNQD